MKKLFLLIFFLTWPWGVCFSGTSDTIRTELDANDQVAVYRPSLGGGTGAANPAAYFRTTLQSILNLLVGIYEPVGTANSLISAHESSFDHDLIETALQPSDLEGLNQIGQLDSGISVTDSGSNGTAKLSPDGEDILIATKDGLTIPTPGAADDISTDDTARPKGGALIITAAETVDMWKIVTQGGYLADGNASGRWPAFCISIGDVSADEGSSAASGETFWCMDEGYGYNTEWSFAVDTPICMSETAGDLVACSALSWNATDDAGQEIGRTDKTDPDKIYFNFHKSVYVHK